MPTAWIQKQKLKDLVTHGKHLYFVFTKGVVQLHLGLFGTVTVNERKKVNRKFFLEFKNGEINGYITRTKKLGSLEEAGIEERNDILSDQFDAAFVKTLLVKQGKKLVADVLMDQKIFSGVGNKIRVEALYRAGVHPWSVVEKIPAKKIDALIKAVRSYAKLFYKNLETKGTNEDFKVYHQEYDAQGHEVTMKLTKDKRKIYFSEAKQELYT